MTELDRQIANLVSAVRDFKQFLQVIGKPIESKVRIPAEWIPYARGEGPAPDGANSNGVNRL